MAAMLQEEKIYITIIVILFILFLIVLNLFLPIFPEDKELRREQEVERIRIEEQCKNIKSLGGFRFIPLECYRYLR
ncbi:MAG TPA: hypothetical protein VJJ73_02275 [Candidatus Paceibacterota bacterium]